MKKSSFVFFALGFIIAANAQDVYKDLRSGWLQKAEESKPALIETIKQPVTLVTLVQDDNVFQHWKAVKSNPVDSLYNNSFKKRSGTVVDFTAFQCWKTFSSFINSTKVTGFTKRSINLGVVASAFCNHFVRWSLYTSWLFA